MEVEQKILNFLGQDTWLYKVLKTQNLGGGGESQGALKAGMLGLKSGDPRSGEGARPGGIAMGVVPQTASGLARVTAFNPVSLQQ